VIIDTPPVMAVTDASVVAHMVSGVVFVVGTEMVSRHAAATALDQLEHSQAKIVGGVLNRVDLDRNPYYYSQYYRKEYADYYVSTAAQ
jgi:Mrp family chromosome partitioning ATPase